MNSSRKIIIGLFILGLSLLAIVGAYFFYSSSTSTVENPIANEETPILEEHAETPQTDISDESVSLEEHYQKGEAAYVNRDLVTIITEMNHVLEIDPNHANAYVYCGYARLYLGEYEEALTNLNKAIQIEPAYVNAYYNRGVVYFYQQKYNEAIVDFNKVVELYPNNLNAYYWRGLAYKMVGDNDMASASFEYYLEFGSDPTWWEQARLELATLKGDVAYPPNEVSPHDTLEFAFQNGDYEMVIAESTSFIEDNPDDTVLYNYQGWALLNLGRYEEAQHDFDKMIEIDSESAVGYSNRGFAYVKSGERDKALSDYDKATELEPNLADAFYWRGYIYYYQGETDKSIENFERYLELSSDSQGLFHAQSFLEILGSTPDALPDDMAQRYDVGDTALDEGNYEIAIAAMSDVIEHNPLIADTYYKRGNAYLELQESDETALLNALSDFNQAIELKPMMVEAYYSRGLVYAQTGGFRDAISDFNYVIELDPDFADAYHQRSQIYVNISLNNYEHAMGNYEKVLELDPEYYEEVGYMLEPIEIEPLEYEEPVIINTPTPMPTEEEPAEEESSTNEEVLPNTPTPENLATPEGVILTETLIITETESTFRYVDSPVLVNPANNEEFLGQEAIINLEWQWTDGLDESEYYFINADFTGQECDGTWSYFRWTKETSLIVDNWLFEQICPSQRLIEWTVYIKEPESTDMENWQERDEGTQLSPIGSTKIFEWRL